MTVTLDDVEGIYSIYSIRVLEYTGVQTFDNFNLHLHSLQARPGLRSRMGGRRRGNVCEREGEGSDDNVINTAGLQRYQAAAAVPLSALHILRYYHHISRKSSHKQIATFPIIMNRLFAIQLRPSHTL